MKCQATFSRKLRNINLSSAKYAHRLMKVNETAILMTVLETHYAFILVCMNRFDLYPSD